MSTTSEYLYDETNIVNSDIKGIKLSEEFINEFNVTDLDWKLLESSLHMNSNMTDYQCRHFVTDTQLTPWRSVRQALLELETRYHSYVEIKHSLRKAEIQKKMVDRDYEKEEDDLAKELIACEASKLDYDITIWRRKYKQSQQEMDTFLKIIKDFIKDESEISFYTTSNEDEERKYWIARMGKQAAMDIIAYGRIGAGNMDSISLMPEEDQVKTLQIAVRYSHMVQGGLENIQHKLQPEFQKFLNNNGVVAHKILPEEYKTDGV